MVNGDRSAAEAAQASLDLHLRIGSREMTRDEKRLAARYQNTLDDALERATDQWPASNPGLPHPIEM